MEKPNQLFTRLEDYYDWDRQIAFVDTLNELTAVEKKDAKTAFKYLREDLGRGFLRKIIGKGPPRITVSPSGFQASHDLHPFYQHLTNNAAWSRKKLTEFAFMVRSASQQKGFKKLRKKLLTLDRFGEGYTELYHSLKFNNSGFTVEYEPHIDKKNKKAVPDFKLIYPDTRERVYVEVATLGASQKERDALRTFNFLSMVSTKHPAGFMVYGEILKPLSEQRASEVAGRMIGTIEDAVRSGNIRTLSISGVIEFAVGPSSMESEMDKWVKEKGIKVVGFGGPGYKVDEFDRIRNRFREKKRQLPDGLPGVIILNSSKPFHSNHSINEIFEKLEEAVYGQPYLLYGIISGGLQIAGEDYIGQYGLHTFVYKTKNVFEAESFIILYNQYSQAKVTPRLMAAIREALLK